MVKLDRITMDTTVEDMRKLLQDSLITNYASFTYDSSKTVYDLEGFAPNDPSLVEIVYLEGVSSDGNYIDINDLTEGVDYQLYDEYSVVPDGYGNSSGKKLYRQLSISSSTFQDNSTVYVTYRFFNPNFKPLLTNLSDSSVAYLLVNALLMTFNEGVNRVLDTVSAFGLDASGGDLDNIASLVGIERQKAARTTGKVKVTNNHSTDNYSITSSTRFVAVRGGVFYAFKPQTSATVGAGQSVYVDVEAVETGKDYNVGSYSISYVFEDEELTQMAPTTVVVTNPPIDDTGAQNYFDNGADDESDESLRDRVKRAFESSKTASYTTIEKAALDTNLVTDAKAYDIDNKKGLQLYNVQLYVDNANGVLSQTSLDVIKQAVDAVKPVGSVVSIRQPMQKYFSFEFDVYMPQSYLQDTTQVQSDIEEAIRTYIKNRNIGNDVVPATLLTIVRNQRGVEDVVIKNIDYTVLSVEHVETDSKIELMTSGVDKNTVALQIAFNAIVATEVATYDGTNAYYDVTNTPIDTRVDPRVNKAVLGYDNTYRPSPLNRTDFFVSATTTRVSYDPNKDTTDPIVSGEKVFIDYNYFDNTTIDGFRVLLGGDSGMVVRGELYTGASEPTTVVSGTQVDVTLDGTEKIYEFKFSAPVTLSPESNTYWIVLTSNIAGNTGSSYLPSSTKYIAMPLGVVVKVNNGSGYAYKYEVPTYQTFYVVPSTKLYERINIPNYSLEPERAALTAVTLNFKESVDT